MRSEADGIQLNSCMEQKYKQKNNEEKLKTTTDILRKKRCGSALCLDSFLCMYVYVVFIAVYYTLYYCNMVRWTC